MKRTARLSIALAGVTAVSLALAGCAGGSTPATEEGGDVTLRFAWWGSDARHTATQADAALTLAGSPRNQSSRSRAWTP